MKWIAISFVGAWIAAIVFIEARATLWEYTPGKASTKNSVPAGPAKEPMLTVTLHPDCPCSQATMDNLAKIKQTASKPFHLRFIFVGSNAEQSKYWHAAGQFSDSDRIVVDEQTAVSDYGAETSGQVFLTDKDGKLLFSGGITDGRGMVSDSEGTTQILKMLAGHGGKRHTPVYGCALQTYPHDGQTGSHQAMGR